MDRTFLIEDAPFMFDTYRAYGLDFIFDDNDKQELDKRSDSDIKRKGNSNKS
jgi:hypothetical protein